MVNTPFIDAAVAGNPKLETRITRAKQALEQGIADQKIFNVDFEQVKTDIARVFDVALENATAAVMTAYKGGEYQYYAGAFNWMDYTRSFQSTSVAKNLRELKRKFDTYTPGRQANENQPGLNLIFRYMDILTDAVQLVEMMKKAKPFIVKGRKPSENPKEVDLTNTGICPVCLHRQKLTFGGNMVDHGYNLKWGTRNGRCFGVGLKAYELSAQGCEEYLKLLKSSIEHCEKQLAEYEKGDVESVPGTKRERISYGYYRDRAYTYHKGEEGFEEALVTAKAILRRDIAGMKGTVPEVEARIKNWTLQPLKYGGAETQERWKSRFLNKK